VIQNVLFNTQIFQPRGHGRNGAKNDFDAGGISVSHRARIATKAAAYSSCFFYLVGEVVIVLAGLDIGRHGIVARKPLQSCQQLVCGDGARGDTLPHPVFTHPYRLAGAKLYVRHATAGRPKQHVVEIVRLPANARFTRVHFNGFKHGSLPLASVCGNGLHWNEGRRRGDAVDLLPDVQLVAAVRGLAAQLCGGRVDPAQEMLGREQVV